MNVEENPYQPPQAAVQDIETNEPMPRPVSVLVALILLATTFVLGLGGILRTGRMLGTSIEADAVFALNIAISALYAWVWLGISRGRNWARIVLLVMTLLRTLSAGLGVWTIHRLTHASFFADPKMLGWLLIGPTLQLAAVMLVFGPGRAWFTPRH